jgi:hypothetical protein
MPRFFRPWVIGLVTTVWLGAGALGLAKLADYSAAAGAPASAPGRWPADSSLARVSGMPTLVVIAHPQCPCSRASIGELARLLAETAAPPRTYVLFVRPPGVDDAWARSDLWDSAAAIPGVEVVMDEGGRAASRFGAATSGQTLLYGADGRLLFSGGITPARGHAGDNVGRSAIVSLLARAVSEQVVTPVFGCALAADRAPCRGDGCRL